MNLEQSYNDLNQSFQKTVVFRLGIDSGFFSEYNNMILCMLYCLKNKVKFTLSSRKSNISKIGYTDYFTNFCPINDSKFHRFYNVRGYNNLNLRQRVLIKIYKTMYQDYLTQDLWNLFHSEKFEKEYFEIDELDVKGDLIESAKNMIKISWKYNSQTQKEINKIIESLNLPEEYVSIHIRRGDKIKETNNIDEISYMEFLKENSKIKNVFVATDDYNVVSSLKKQFGDYNFYTLTNPLSMGYIQHDFNQLSYETKKRELIILFATIEIMSKGQYFFGTYSSNIGMYMAMRLGTTKAKDISNKSWHIC